MTTRTRRQWDNDGEDRDRDDNDDDDRPPLPPLPQCTPIHCCEQLPARWKRRVADSHHNPNKDVSGMSRYHNMGDDCRDNRGEEHHL